MRLCLPDQGNLTNLGLCVDQQLCTVGLSCLACMHVAGVLTACRNRKDGMGYRVFQLSKIGALHLDCAAVAQRLQTEVVFCCRWSLSG